MQLDSAEIVHEPPTAILVERVARTVVDDEEDLAAAAATDELLQEL
jgi:uncharacterized protein (DUF1800 family)